MTTRNTTPPAPREFCVYAPQTVHRHVEAASAEEAFRAAQDPASFEPCGPDLTFDRAVQDVPADEYVHVGRAASCCKTCGSEIVPTVNDSHFSEGECGPCEHRRYATQPTLVTRAKEVLEAWDGGDLAGAVNRLGAAVLEAQHG